MAARLRYLSVATTILVADDHAIVRQGLEALLRTEPDFDLIGAAANGAEAIELARQHHPNVLVLDLSMPGVGGMEVLRQVKSQAPDVHVIVLSMHRSDAYVLEALRTGAQGYVLKDSSLDELIAGIRQVGGGGHYLSSALSERAIEAYIRQADEPADPYETLTPREREVLYFAAEGLSNPDIAQRLTISPRTAEMHRQHLMRKLGLNTQTELIRYALRKGIISMEG